MIRVVRGVCATPASIDWDTPVTACGSGID
jgi:hypothetical protein